MKEEAKRKAELIEWIAELDCSAEIMEMLATDESDDPYKAAWAELNSYVGDWDISQAMLEIIREA